MANSVKLEQCGEAIRRRRTAAGLTLQELADRLGWDKSRLSKYENSHLSMSLSGIERVAHALHCPAERLVLECLRQRYPRLVGSDTEVGRLYEEIISRLEDA